MDIQRVYHLRKKLRLDGYDYSQPGGYFITTNIDNPQVILSHIETGITSLTRYGQIVNQCWLDLQNHYPNIILDSYCVMPNHFHGILIINDPCSGGSLVPARLDRSWVIPPERANYQQGKTRPYAQYSINEIVRAFKSFSARKINILRHGEGQSIWQRSFYDRIIRDETDLIRIREYIMANPINWDESEQT